MEGKDAMGSAERALVASEFQTRKWGFLRSCFPY
jgi:hypothetical protein